MKTREKVPPGMYWCKTCKMLRKILERVGHYGKHCEFCIGEKK